MSDQTVRRVVVLSAALYTVGVADAQEAGLVKIPWKVEPTGVVFATTSVAVHHGAPVIMSVNRPALSNLEPDYNIERLAKPTKPSEQGS